MPLLWSFGFFILSQPPVKTGGYKYFAPMERGCEGLMNGTKRRRFPDLIRRGGGRSTFKRAAVEDMRAEQEKLL
jgi:hypothetical protein